MNGPEGSHRPPPCSGNTPLLLHHPSPCSGHTPLLLTADRSAPLGSHSVAQQSWESAKEGTHRLWGQRMDLNKLTNIHTPHLWGTAKTNSMLVLDRVCLVFRVKLHQPTVKRNVPRDTQGSCGPGAGTRAGERRHGGSSSVSPSLIPSPSSLVSCWPPSSFWHSSVDCALSPGCYNGVPERLGNSQEK